MKTIIKRYPNRKLYDTAAKQYITLDGIAELIRSGEDVQIVDHSSGEDLTTLTLTQIIFEQEKKKSGFLPRPVLTGLIQAGGDTLGVLRRTLASPLDTFRQVDEEIRRRVQNLIKLGELTEAEGRGWISKLTEHPESVSEPLDSTDEAVARILHEHGVPTRQDFNHLTEQIDTLVAKLDGIAGDDKTD